MRNRLVILILLISFPAGLPAQNTFEIGPDSKPKSESAALLLSLAGSVLPVVAGLTVNNSELGSYLFGSGILIGPSLGYFYCSNGEKGLKSIGIRAGLCTGTLVLGSVFNSRGIVYLGAGSVIIQGVSDILNAPNTVREYNQYLDDFSFALAPPYDAEKGALMLRFTYQFN